MAQKYCDIQKKPIERPTKETYEETYKRNQYANKRDLERNIYAYTRNRLKKHTRIEREHRLSVHKHERNAHTSNQTYERDLQKRPTKETYTH